MNSFGRTSGVGKKVSERDSSSASMTIQNGNKFNASPKDYDMWSSAQRNTDHRYGYFTFLSADPNGIWRAVAVPLNYLDVGVHAGSGSQSFTDGTFSGAKVHYHNRSKALTNKVRRGDTFPGKSSGRSSFNSNNFGVNDMSKLGMYGKKNNAKKTKKKGKRDRKRLLDAGAANVAGVLGSATDETVSNNTTDPGTGPISWETTSTVLSPDSCGDSSEDYCTGSIIKSESLKKFNANIEGVHTLEAKHGEQTSIPDLSASKTVQDSHNDSLSSMKDSGSMVLAEANNFLVSESSSVCSKDADFATGSSIAVDVRLKESRKVPRNSNLSKKSDSRKFHSHSAEKNNASWQEVCGNVTNNYSSGLGKREANSYGGVNSLKIVPFPEQNPNISRTKILSATKEKNQSYSKVRNPGKMKRNTSAGSKQELNCQWRKSLYASKSTSSLCSKIDTELNINCTNVKPVAEKNDRNPRTSVRLEGCSSKVKSLQQKNSSLFSLNDQTPARECKVTPTNCEDGNPRELMDFSANEHNNKSQVSGPSMHKWIPIGIKDTEFCRSAPSDSAQCVQVSKENLDLDNTATTVASSESFEQSSRTKNAQHRESNVSIGNGSAESTVCNESDMILQAVNDSYKAQLASEAVEKATGSTVAELERFLLAASPVISLSNCNTSPDEVLVTPICRNKIPNLSLGNLWQWYEKHGIFGLEVKAEDYDNSKRLGMDRFQFRAYFVPFLSAVQLFRRSSDTSRRVLDNGAKIFSMLVPQPKIVGGVTKKVNDCVSSEPELVYEYFEAERPQHRRPLFEMINDLVSSSEPFQGRAFGDPSKLVTMALSDLDPKSWYSVAWYPIYRIPDEKFHSAFLTYHSLGHFVQGTVPSDSVAGNACVVSPVVGLQSYNTQGECWLRPKNLPKEVPSCNHIEILKERLETLEHTASVMARAEVVKGTAISVNRQPDYEFFLSRRRW